jgi:Bacterial transcriptional activator domain
MFSTGATGLEPATSGVTGRRSNQLNYAPGRRSILAAGEVRRVVRRASPRSDLAYLVRTRVAPSRERLAGLSWPEAVAIPGLGHELLDGMAFRSSPGFEMWLENERRHIAGTTSAVLHQAALAQLARGEVVEAVQHASELVRLNPYDENAHVLLIRCLRAACDLEGAATQVQACTDVFRRDFGIDPTSSLRAAASANELPAEARVSGSAAALAQVEAGEAALAAGAVEAGLQRLRGAVAAARNVDDPGLLARALVALGGALVHAPVRGADEEGAAALHEGTLPRGARRQV